MTDRRRLRAGLLLGAAVLTLAVTVASCSSDSQSEEEPNDGVETPTTDSPRPSDEPGGEQAADVADLKQLYEDYWDAWVELENAKVLDFSVLDGIATEALIQREGPRLEEFRDDGGRRQGEPTITNVTVAVTGDTALIESCKNEVGWQLVRNGEVLHDAVPAELRAPHPFRMAAERSADGWLISRTLSVKDARIACD